VVLLFFINFMVFKISRIKNVLLYSSFVTIQNISITRMLMPSWSARVVPIDDQRSQQERASQFDLNIIWSQ